MNIIFQGDWVLFNNKWSQVVEINHIFDKPETITVFRSCEMVELDPNSALITMVRSDLEMQELLSY